MPSSTCGTVVVFDPFEPSAVSVTCPAPPQEVAVGESFRVEWVVSNGNDADAAVEYELLVGGSVVDSGSATVSGSQSFSAEVVIDEISGQQEEVGVTVDLPSVSKA